MHVELIKKHSSFYGTIWKFLTDFEIDFHLLDNYINMNLTVITILYKFL